MADLEKISYRGELHDVDGGVTMFVTREVVRPSGFRLPSGLAYITFGPEKREVSGLVMPNRMETAFVASRRLESPTPSLPSKPIEAITEDDLIVFTSKIVAKGRSLLDKEGMTILDGEVATEGLTEPEIHAVNEIGLALGSQKTTISLSASDGTGFYL